MLFQKRKISFLVEALIVNLFPGIIIPFLFFLKMVVSQGEIIWGNYLFGVFFSYVVSFCIYFFNVGIVQYLQGNEKKFRSQFNRIMLELIITICISAIVMTLVFLTFLRFFNYNIHNNAVELYNNIIIAIIVNIVAIFLFEALFFFKKWKNSLIESEQLRRKNVEIQYAALTSQVNPHFLFNSLNVLSSLIQTDPDKAVIFTREFSKIYRYVLDSNDKLIVPLQDELNFLYSFLYLQKIRFDKALEYHIEVNAGCLDLLLPPLSLQLLVENAIKHNEISDENPLTINISGNIDRVRVSNNYRPIKKATTSEGGLGVKNLMERYSHYTDVKPEFYIENQYYHAIIPLLKDE